MPGFFVDGKGISITGPPFSAALHLSNWWTDLKQWTKRLVLVPKLSWVASVPPIRMRRPIPLRESIVTAAELLELVFLYLLRTMGVPGSPAHTPLPDLPKAGLRWQDGRSSNEEIGMCQVP